MRSRWLLALAAASLATGCGNRKDEMRSSVPPLAEVRSLPPVTPSQLEALVEEPVAPSPARAEEEFVPPVSWEHRARSVVVGIQEQLVERGHAPGYPDGLYGPRTEEAVESFQSTAGLPRTGIANRKTLHALFEEPIAHADQIDLTSGRDPPMTTPLPDSGMGASTIAMVALAIGLSFAAGRVSKPMAGARSGSR